MARRQLTYLDLECVSKQRKRGRVPSGALHHQRKRVARLRSGHRLATDGSLTNRQRSLQRLFRLGISLLLKIELPEVVQIRGYFGMVRSHALLACFERALIGRL